MVVKKIIVMTIQKTYLDLLPVNLNQGLLVDNCTEPMQIYGAYNSDKKEYVIKEGWLLSDFSMPDQMKGYKFIGIAGHFTVGFWDFKLYTERDI